MRKAKVEIGMTNVQCPMTGYQLPVTGYRLPARLGISLLEVLISMGVLTIGLLGVSAMFPVGAYKVGQAQRHDRAAELGQAAFHDIVARRMLRPEISTWVQPTGQPLPMNGTRFHPGFAPLVSGATTLNGIPFAVDPLWCSYDEGTTGYDHRALTSQLSSIPSARFPCQGVANETMSLPRVTLPDINSNPPSTPIPLPAELAQKLFTLQDDLIVDLPDDLDQPAQQTFSQSTNGNLRRGFDGHYSWMFTAVPKTGSDGDLYTVSVVVFYRRRLDIDPASPPDDPGKPPERMVEVDSTPGDGTADGRVLGGVGGVEANLCIKEDDNTLKKRVYLEDIHPGEWVMLSADTVDGPIYKWYRITAVEDEIVERGNDQYTRWVSLLGPDLDLDVDNNGIQDSPVYISLFEGAIAVYERTMRVEDSSMWVSE